MRGPEIPIAAVPNMLDREMVNGFLLSFSTEDSTAFLDIPRQLAQRVTVNPNALDASQFIAVNRDQFS